MGIDIIRATSTWTQPKQNTLLANASYKDLSDIIHSNAFQYTLAHYHIPNAYHVRIQEDQVFIVHKGTLIPLIQYQSEDLKDHAHNIIDIAQKLGSQTQVLPIEINNNNECSLREENKQLKQQIGALGQACINLKETYQKKEELLNKSISDLTEEKELLVNEIKGIATSEPWNNLVGSLNATKIKEEKDPHQLINLLKTTLDQGHRSLKENYEKEIEIQKDLLEKATTTLKTVEDSNRELTTKLDLLNKEREELVNEIRDISKSEAWINLVGDLNAEKIAKETNPKELIKLLKETFDVECATRKKLFDNATDPFTEENEGLKADLEERQKELNRLSSLTEKHENTINQLQTRINELEEKETDATNLKSQIITFKKQTTRLLKENSDLRVLEETSKSIYLQNQATIEELRKKLYSAENSLRIEKELHQKDNETSAAAYSELQSRLNQAVAIAVPKIDSLAEEIESLKDEIDALEWKNSLLEEGNSLLNDQLVNLDNVVALQKRTADKALQEKEKAEENLAKVKQESENALKTHISERAHLEKKLNLLENNYNATCNAQANFLFDHIITKFDVAVIKDLESQSNCPAGLLTKSVEGIAYSLSNNPNLFTSIITTFLSMPEGSAKSALELQYQELENNYTCAINTSISQIAALRETNNKLESALKELRRPNVVDQGTQTEQPYSDELKQELENNRKEIIDWITKHKWEGVAGQLLITSNFESISTKELLGELEKALEGESQLLTTAKAKNKELNDQIKFDESELETLQRKIEHLEHENEKPLSIQEPHHEEIAASIQPIPNLRAHEIIRVNQLKGDILELQKEVQQLEKNLKHEQKWKDRYKTTAHDLRHQLDIGKEQYRAREGEYDKELTTLEQTRKQELKHFNEQISLLKKEISFLQSELDWEKLDTRNYENMLAEEQIKLNQAYTDAQELRTKLGHTEVTHLSTQRIVAEKALGVIEESKRLATENRSLLNENASLSKRLIELNNEVSLLQASLLFSAVPENLQKNIEDAMGRTDLFNSKENLAELLLSENDLFKKIIITMNNLTDPVEE